MNKETKRIAVVTGGASGLGLAIAQKFVNEGVHVIIIGRNESKLAAAKAEMGELAGYVAYDLSDLTGIPQLVNGIMEQYGQIDILVNNAGINQKKEFLDVTDEDFQNIMMTNVNAVFALSREVIRQMLVRQQGSIVNISSMASQYGIPKVISYTASKSAIEGMTRAMATELSGRGIRINCVAPGFIATDMSAKALDNDPERKAKVMGRTSMGHLGTPEDIAEAVYFLSSPASKYITGSVIVVDGGNSVGF